LGGRRDRQPSDLHRHGLSRLRLPHTVNRSPAEACGRRSSFSTTPSSGLSGEGGPCRALILDASVRLSRCRAVRITVHFESVCSAYLSVLPCSRSGRVDFTGRLGITRPPLRLDTAALARRRCSDEAGGRPTDVIGVGAALSGPISSGRKSGCDGNPCPVGPA